MVRYTKAFKLLQNRWWWWWCPSCSSYKIFIPQFLAVATLTITQYWSIMVIPYGGTSFPDLHQQSSSTTKQNLDITWNVASSSIQLHWIKIIFLFIVTSNILIHHRRQPDGWYYILSTIWQNEGDGKFSPAHPNKLSSVIFIDQL